MGEKLKGYWLNYRDKEHCDEDIATLKAYVDRLEFEPPKA